MRVGFSASTLLARQLISPFTVTCKQLLTDLRNTKRLSATGGSFRDTPSPSGTSFPPTEAWVCKFTHDNGHKSYFFKHWRKVKRVLGPSHICFIILKCRVLLSKFMLIEGHTISGIFAYRSLMDGRRSLARELWAGMRRDNLTCYTSDW